MISLMISQVADAEAALKMKIHPVNAFFQCYNFAYLSGLPREELHQFLVGLYGEYIVPSAFHLITSVLRKPEFILSCSVRQGGQQISGEQWHARKGLDTPQGSSILVGFVDIAPWSDLWICRPFLRHVCWGAHRETSYWRSDPYLAPEPSFSVSRLDWSRGDVLHMWYHRHIIDIICDIVWYYL